MPRCNVMSMTSLSVRFSPFTSFEVHHSLRRAVLQHVSKDRGSIPLRLTTFVFKRGKRLLNGPHSLQDGGMPLRRLLPTSFSRSLRCLKEKEQSSKDALEPSESAL